MTLLTREAILGKQDVATKDVPVPEWGGDVRVRSMTVAERNEFAERAKKEPAGVQVWLLAQLAVDDKGKRLFQDEDAATLQQKNNVAFDRVIAAVLQVNGMDPKRIEDAEKN